MSKSAPLPASRIGITDDASTIAKRLKSAVTDSIPHMFYDPADRPGLSNLLLIWSALDESKRSPEQLAQLANDSGWGMGKLKEQVTDAVVARVEPIRREYEKISADKGYLAEVAQRGRETARQKAAETMEEVRRVVGLGPL